VQQTYRVFSETENLARCTPAKVGDNSDWTSIMNIAEKNRANFCKVLDGKLLFSALYGMYTVTLNELKAVLMVNALAGQSGAVNKTSMGSTAQNDLQEVQRRKGRISNTSQSAKKSTKPVPISGAVNLPPKAVLTRQFFSPLRTTGMDTEQKTPRKPGRPPRIMMTSTTNLIRIQSGLKDHVKGEHELRNT
jgi:hypothetical protein